MPEVLRLLLDRGATAIQPGNHAEELHQFRLDIKRFRYTLELFVPIYGPEIEPLLERLRRLQSLLGDMNDCVATAEHLRKLRSGLPAELDEYLRRRYDACFTKLTTEWSRHLAKPAEQKRWAQRLAFQSDRKRDPISRSLKARK